jgi:hypothetical protein
MAHRIYTEVWADEVAGANGDGRNRRIENFEPAVYENGRINGEGSIVVYMNRGICVGDGLEADRGRGVGVEDDAVGG